jgi:hypothetical protein
LVQTLWGWVCPAMPTWTDANLNFASSYKYLKKELLTWQEFTNNPRRQQSRKGEKGGKERWWAATEGEKETDMVPAPYISWSLLCRYKCNQQ